MGASPELSRPLGTPSVGRRATAAMFYVVSWSFLNLAITLVGSLVLTRGLSPRDFGLIAIGQTIATLAATVTDGGIASGFIRQAEGISRAVLRSINGVQLLVALGLAAIITPVAMQFGTAGALTALIVWSLPIVSLQTAGRVLLGRELRFRDITLIEAFGVLAFYSWSIAGVVAGYGVWSLASGFLIRAGVSTLVVGYIVGWGVLMPSLRRYREVFAVIGFGIRFSLTMLTNVLYEQAKNIIILLVGGTSALGLWTLAARVLQVPNALYQPIHQLSFPAFSQYMASDRDTRPILERVSRLTFVASVLFLPAFLVSIPSLISVLFTSEWADAAEIFPGVVLALFIGIPIAAPCMQFLYAAGRPAEVLRINAVSALASLAAIALLYPLIGLAGIGLGTVPGAVIESAVLGRLVHRMNGASLFGPLPAFLGAAVLAVAGGVAIDSLVGHDLASAVLSAATAVAIATAVCKVVQGSALRDLLDLARRSVSTAVAHDG